MDYAADYMQSQSPNGISAAGRNLIGTGNIQDLSILSK
jgi:hypothetical protein